MIRAFVILTVAAFTVLSCDASFKFEIKKNLNTGEDLSSPIQVEVTDSDKVTVGMKVPKSLQLSDAFVFFANEAKSILQVSLKENLQGTFFSVPYKIEKEMTGEKTTTREEENYKVISGAFPKQWLPENCDKINAAVIDTNAKIYNYYDIINFKISIPDLLLVEEYKNYNPSAP